MHICPFPFHQQNHFPYSHYFPSNKTSLLIQSFYKKYSKKELLKSNNDLSQRLDKLTNVVIALGNYFDDSIGVSDTKKQAFKEAVNELNDISTSIKENTEKEVVVEQLEVLPNIEVKQKSNDNTIIR